MALSWEEVPLKILQPRHHNHHRNLFILALLSRPLQVGVQVPCKNQLCLPQPLSHFRLHIPNHSLVSRRQVTSDGVPAPLPRCQLAYDDIHTKLPYRLNCKVEGVPLKQHNSVTRNDTVTGQSAGVDTVRQFRLLKNPDIHVSLAHSP